MVFWRGVGFPPQRLRICQRRSQYGLLVISRGTSSTPKSLRSESRFGLADNLGSQG